MLSKFDPRVISPDGLRLIRSCQSRVPCELGGGVALSGAYLAHRLSQDVDLFCKRRDEVRQLVQALPAIAAETGMTVQIVRDAGDFARVHCVKAEQVLELDIVVESPPDLSSPPPPIEGVTVRSLEDLRASKLTCLLSRSEPRDLVDVLFLDRAGYPVEADLPLALRKDSGIDPGVLAWLLGQFPTHPLPQMLKPLTETELIRFRDELRERLRKIVLPA
ncbi:MAG: nucleotidyl transferase AbiEii/AbiGii toxin family protein [Myxococcaceae bacterium]